MTLQSVYTEPNFTLKSNYTIMTLQPVYTETKFTLKHTLHLNENPHSVYTQLRTSGRLQKNSPYSEILTTSKKLVLDVNFLS